MCVPPQSMKELALQVYKDINQHSDHLHSRAEWGFRDLDKLLDLLDEYGISVIEISNPHDWQLHFEYTQESRSDVNFFMIWCKARGKLNEIKCLVHPQAKEIESDWLARRTYRSQPNTKKKSTRNQNVRLGFDGKKISSVSDDFEFTNLDCTSPNDGSKLNGWRAEKYAFQYLRTELLSEISEEYDHNWEDIQYVFKSKGKEIAKLIWHDRYLIEGAEEVNNPGFDIEKVYDNKSTYYEIKSGTILIVVFVISNLTYKSRSPTTSFECGIA